MFEDFHRIVGKGEEFYKSVGKVWCPYLAKEVHFNAAGLEHLKFKRVRVARPNHDQYMRFKLLHLAPEILKLSRTVQGIWETSHFEKIRVHGRTDTVLKSVTYYEFIAVLEKVRVKVVVKQIENSQSFFWSLIPSWGVNKETRKRKLYKGNPEED